MNVIDSSKLEHDVFRKPFHAFRHHALTRGPPPQRGSMRSRASALANLRVGHRFDPRTQLTLDIYNLFDRRANDIEYGYASQLPGETAPVFDRHLHPTQPRSLRLTLSHRF